MKRTLGCCLLLGIAVAAVMPFGIAADPPNAPIKGADPVTALSARKKAAEEKKARKEQAMILKMAREYEKRMFAEDVALNGPRTPAETKAYFARNLPVTIKRIEEYVKQCRENGIDPFARKEQRKTKPELNE